MKLFRLFSVAFVLVCLSIPLRSALAQSSTDTHNPQVIVQISTYDYFAAGNYYGFMPISTLHNYGDFGLGTYDKVDGEMVEVDGSIYQIQQDGKAHLADESSLTPFAVVTFWQSAPSVPIKAGLTMDQLKAQIDQIATDQNEFVAIRVEGSFSTLKLRTEAPAQKPYPIFTDFIKSQIVVDLKNISGVLVGVRAPVFSKGLNVVGYHFHFISADRQTGGHVLDLTTGSALLEYNEKPVWEIYLPESSAAKATAQAPN